MKVLEARQACKDGATEGDMVVQLAVKVLERLGAVRKESNHPQGMSEKHKAY